MRSIRKTLTELDVFKGLHNNYLELREIQKIIQVIFSTVMQDYFWVIKSTSHLLCVCVCVCVCARARARAGVYVCVCVKLIISLIKLIPQIFPPKNEIREAYLMNNYSKVSLVELQSSSAFVSENAKNTTENFSNFS